jgi:hypothetical protein
MSEPLVNVRIIGGVFFVDYGTVHFCGSKSAMTGLKMELEAALRANRKGQPYPEAK